MHIAHICSFKNGVHSSQLNLNNCVLSIRYLIDITLSSPKHPPFGRFMLNSNSCFPNYTPNNISFVEYNALFLILPSHPAENISQQMNAFSNFCYPHYPPKTSVIRLTTHPPTPPLQENIRLRDITKCTRNKDKQVQKAKPLGTCFPEWKILVFAQEMRGVGRGDSLGRGTLVHSATEK